MSLRVGIRVTGQLIKPEELHFLDLRIMGRFLRKLSHHKNSDVINPTLFGRKIQSEKFKRRRDNATLFFEFADGALLKAFILCNAPSWQVPSVDVGKPHQKNFPVAQYDGAAPEGQGSEKTPIEMSKPEDQSLNEGHI